MPVTRFKLKPNCLLVDSHDLDGPDFDYDHRKPMAIPYAHVMDKSPTLEAPPKDAKYTPLNNVQAFIARFIVMGVDTDPTLYLHKIIASEYNMPEAKALKEIKDTLTLLDPYVEQRIKDRPYRPDPVPGPGQQHSGKYDLDFKVNFLGTGVFKGPL